jgi:hypothetical protein
MKTALWLVSHSAGHLVLMFFPSLDAAGRLTALRLTPLQIRKLRLNRPPAEDVRWLCATVNRIGAPFGSRVDLTSDGSLVLALSPAATGE